MLHRVVTQLWKIPRKFVEQVFYGGRSVLNLDFPLCRPILPLPSLRSGAKCFESRCPMRHSAEDSKNNSSVSNPRNRSLLMTRIAIAFATLDHRFARLRIVAIDFAKPRRLAELHLGFPRQNDKLRVEFQSCKNNQSLQQRKMPMSVY
jgi:hypothetical protein